MDIYDLFPTPELVEEPWSKLHCPIDKLFKGNVVSLLQIFNEPILLRLTRHKIQQLKNKTIESSEQLYLSQLHIS